MAAGPENVDLLLRHYERELACFAAARNGLRPLSVRLVAMLAQSIDQPGDGEVRSEARGLRQLYRRRREELGDVLNEWATVKGSGDALWSMVSAMTPEQVRRFDDIAAADTALADDQREFEELSHRVRRLMLLFEEMVV